MLSLRGHPPGQLWMKSDLPGAPIQPQCQRAGTGRDSHGPPPLHLASHPKGLTPRSPARGTFQSIGGRNMTTAAKEMSLVLTFAQRFLDCAWMAPVLSFFILVVGEITRSVGLFPAPHHIRHVWLASVAVHAVVALSLLVRCKFGRGLASVGLLTIPCACLWLLAQQ